MVERQDGARAIAGVKFIFLGEFAGMTDGVGGGRRRDPARLAAAAVLLLAVATVALVAVSRIGRGAEWGVGLGAVEMRQRIYVPKNIPGITNMVGAGPFWGSSG